MPPTAATLPAKLLQAGPSAGEGCLLHGDALQGSSFITLLQLYTHRPSVYVISLLSIWSQAYLLMMNLFQLPCATLLRASTSWSNATNSPICSVFCNLNCLFYWCNKSPVSVGMTTSPLTGVKLVELIKHSSISPVMITASSHTPSCPLQRPINDSLWQEPFLKSNYTTVCSAPSSQFPSFSLVCVFLWEHGGAEWMGV